LETKTLELIRMMVGEYQEAVESLDGERAAIHYNKSVLQNQLIKELIEILSSQQKILDYNACK
jgi:hypothetical protein